MNKEVFPFVLKLFYVDNFLVSAWLGQQTTDLLLTRQHYLFAVLRVSTCYDLPQIKKIDIWRRVDDGEKVNSSEKTLIKPAALMLFVSVVIMSSLASKWQALLFSLSVISTSDFSLPSPTPFPYPMPEGCLNPLYCLKQFVSKNNTYALKQMHKFPRHI